MPTATWFVECTRPLGTPDDGSGGRLATELEAGIELACSGQSRGNRGCNDS